MAVVVLGVMGFIGFLFMLNLWHRADRYARRVRELEYENEVQDEIEKSRTLPIDSIVERIRRRLTRRGEDDSASKRGSGSDDGDAR